MGAPDTNNKILLIAAVLFLANQVIDAILKYWFGAGYDSICLLDCTWYVKLIEIGYYPLEYVYNSDGQPNWAFFPLFPLIGKGVVLLTGLAPETAVIVVAKIFFLASIVSFLHFCRQYQSQAGPWTCGAVLVFGPYSIYANAGYTEPLFLFLSCAGFILLSRDKFMLSGATAGVLSSVRVVGVLFMFPYLVRGISKLISREAKLADIVLGLAFIPFGLSLFMLYLYFRLGDALAFSHAQIHWTRYVQNPIDVLLASAGGPPPEWIMIVNVALALVAIAFLMYRRLYGLAIFSLLCTLVPLSTSIWSMPRYIWWQAPVLFAAAQLLKSRWLAAFCLPAMLGGLILMYYFWFSGELFVI